MTVETYAICCATGLWTTFLVGTNAGAVNAEAVAKKSADATAVNFILILFVVVVLEQERQIYGDMPYRTKIATKRNRRFQSRQKI